MVAGVAVSAAAQRNELAGMVGRTFISNQAIPGATFFNNEVRFGNGLTFEADYSREVLGNEIFGLALEVPFVWNRDEDLNTGANLIPQQYGSIFVTPAVRLHVFPQTAFSPWLSFGGGLGYFSESSTLVFGGPNPGKTGTTTGALQMGAGLDVRIKEHWSVRGELRDFWSGVPQLNVKTDKSRQHNILVAGGIVWHFGK